MKPAMAAALALGILASPAVAQEMPTPGAEQAQIGFFEGTWNYEGESKESPMGPGGKISMTETCRWFEGGFHLVCESSGTTPRGPMSGHSVIGYDLAAERYTLYALNSRGEAYNVSGGVTGNVWTWTAETTMDGTLFKFRATNTEESPTSYAFRLEMSAGDGEWTVLEEGTAAKK